MAFKIKRFIPESPLRVEGSGSNVNPGKKLDSAQEHSKVRNYVTQSDNFLNDKNNDGNMFTRALTKLKKQRAENIQAYQNKKSGVSPTVSETGSVKTKKLTEGGIQGGSSSVKGTSADTRAYDPFSKKTDVKKRDPRNKVEYVKKGKAAEIVIIGNQEGLSEKEVLDSTPEISTKKPTVKVAPKDNSKKAIRKRKKADKAAGVSKSQMRANKAKSKSEAALAKAKKSKNPDYRAQLKRKSDRLAKRAKRKGNS